MASSSESRRAKLRDFPFDEEKFADLIAYISARGSDDPCFDATKLNVALYYSDFDAYRLLGQPISGASYQKFSAGPVAQEWYETQKRMIAAGEARVEERRHFNRLWNCLTISPERASSAETLSEQERAIVDQVLEFVLSRSDDQVSEYVRREPGWALAKQRERIPYESAWLKGTPISPDVELGALKFAREHGYL